MVYYFIVITMSINITANKLYMFLYNITMNFKNTSITLKLSAISFIINTVCIINAAIPMSLFLKDEAYEQLVQMIDDGKFEYDKKYSLNQIAIELNMSKTPVRDAIQKLADEKRIDILPSRGIQLHMPTADEVKQHYHFSNAIEGYCVAELAKAYAKNPKNIYVRRLKYIMQDMKAYLDEQTDFGEYFALDRQFHIELIDSLQDPYFSSLKSSGMGFLNHPELKLNEKIPRHDVDACHEKILDAICKGNHSAAFDAMMEHAQLMTNQL